MQDIRPISLINVMAKVVSKVMANRLQGILPDIISLVVHGCRGYCYLINLLVTGQTQWKGTPSIQPANGLRQPLSPYSFYVLTG